MSPSGAAPCADHRLLRVRLTERALCLSEFASKARIRLSQCAPEKTLYCASERSSCAPLHLGRLARHHDVPQRDILERLILAADKRVLDKLNDAEWTEYMRLPVTR